MLATFHELGVVPSFSRPSVSNNPYRESLFRTMNAAAGVIYRLVANKTFLLLNLLFEGEWPDFVE